MVPPAGKWLTLVGGSVCVVAAETRRTRMAVDRLVIRLSEPQTVLSDLGGAYPAAVHFAVPGDGRWVERVRVVKPPTFRGKRLQVSSCPTSQGRASTAARTKQGHGGRARGTHAVHSAGASAMPNWLPVAEGPPRRGRSFGADDQLCCVRMMSVQPLKTVMHGAQR